MATALNIFKTVTANLTTGGNVLYTAPSTKTSIVLMVQASNLNSTNTASVSFFHRTNTFANTALAYNFEIPPKDAASIIGGGTGKLVLETGQSVYASANVNNTVQLVMSILETAND